MLPRPASLRAGNGLSRHLGGQKAAGGFDLRVGCSATGAILAVIGAVSARRAAAATAKEWTIRSATFGERLMLRLTAVLPAGSNALATQGPTTRFFFFFKGIGWCARREKD